MIYETMSENEKEKTFVYDDFESLYSKLKSIAKKGDLILSMGAGEINKLIYKFYNEMCQG